MKGLKKMEREVNGKHENMRIEEGGVGIKSFRFKNADCRRVGAGFETRPYRRP